jgi:methanogenic corrinoid protein MtbC1
MNDARERLLLALLASERLKAEGILNEMKDQVTPNEIVEQIVTPILEIIGQMWNKGDASLSQIYMSSRICEDFLDTIMPTESPLRKYQPKLAIATLDDYHTLGKMIVYATVRANGYAIVDYGTLNAKALSERVKMDGVEVLLVSTMMLRSALRVRDLRDFIDDDDKAPFLVVGGAPFVYDTSLWREVGADAGGLNSSDAINIINDYNEKKK